jgi:protoporphyrinogen oxidase
MVEKHIKNLIIGAGISGLTLAYYLKKDYLILEKENEAGGYCRTIKNPNYVWDYAGHFYHFKTDRFKELFLSMVEPEEIVTQTKITKIYYKDKLVDFPFQMNIHQLDKDEFIECLYDLYFKEEKDNYDNFLDMLYGKFGNATVEKFLRPYNEKLYAVDLKKLDTDAMGRFFPYADLDAIIRNMKKEKSNSYNDTFLYLKKGTQYFIDKLYSKLDKNNISFNTEVNNIDIENKFVLTNKGEKIYYQNLINTTPLNVFFRSLNNEQTDKIVDAMSYNKVLVFNLGFDTPSARYKDEHWVYFPDKKLNFYRIGFYNNILRTDKLSVYVEIGYSKDQVIDTKKELTDTLSNMKKVGIIGEEHKLIDYSSVIMDPAYVHISHETDAVIQNKISELNDKNVFTLGRYGKWTYSSMEDCMVWAEELSTRIG